MPNKIVTVAQVIEEARSWIDTPFVHQGRAKGRGADCVGLIIGVAHRLGISSFDYRAYGRQPQPEQMGKLLEDNLIKVNDPKELKSGYIFWLRIFRPRHLAIYTEKNTIIHIYDRVGSSHHKPVGRCIEHILNEAWKRKIVAVYRYPGVIDG